MHPEPAPSLGGGPNAKDYKPLGKPQAVINGVPWNPLQKPDECVLCSLSRIQYVTTSPRLLDEQLLAWKATFAIIN